MTATTRATSKTSCSWRILSTACALALLPVASNGAAQQTKDEQIMAAAETELLAYMNRSTTFIAAGHARAHHAFFRWYIDDFLPSLGKEPPIVEVFQAAFRMALSRGGALLPLPGPVAGLAIELFRAGFDQATARPAPDVTPDRFKARLDDQLERTRLSLLTLADRVERDEPNLFEDAMLAYLDEELETPGIHAASEYRLGADTREKLRAIGFPEPDSTTALDVAERILTPMVLATKQKWHPRAAQILSAEQRAIDARITARRILFPNDPGRYCEGAWQLGMLKPDDCR